MQLWSIMRIAAARAATVVLLVGSGVGTHVALAGPPALPVAAQTAQEAKTSREWYDYYLPRYRAVTAAWHEILKDPAKHAKWANKDSAPLAYLERAQLFMTSCEQPYGLLPWAIDLGGLTAAGKTAVRQLIGDYRAWQKARGDLLLYKWLKGQTLTAEEEPWLPLIKGHCTILCRERSIGWYMMPDGRHAAEKGLPDELMGVSDPAELKKMVDTYVNHIKTTSKSVSLKGYRGEGLTERDLDVLRIYCWIPDCPGSDIQPSCADAYSYGLSPHRADGENPNLEFDLAYPPDHGSPMVNLRMLPLESVLKRPEYTDGYFNDPLLFYKPEAIMLHLNRFLGYTGITVPSKKDQTPLKAVTFAPLPPQSADSPDHVRLHSLKKPVLFLPNLTSDIDGPRCLDVTKDGEIWVCEVRPPQAGETMAADTVVIGQDVPGDSRGNSGAGAFHGHFDYDRGYLKFDLAGLKGKKIKNAKFRFHCELQGLPLTINAYACSDAWTEKEITWVNQPLKFPAPGKPVAALRLTEEVCRMTEEEKKSHMLARLVELDLTEYAKKALEDGRDHLSVCLGITEGLGGKSRLAIFNKNRCGVYGAKFTNEMPYAEQKLPWLAVETTDASER